MGWTKGSAAFWTMLLALASGCRDRAPSESEPMLYEGTAVTDPSDPAYRSTVALGSLKNGVFVPLCSGTVIGPYHVVTAAHCFAQKDFGDLKIGFGTDPRQNPLYDVTHVSYPDDYWEEEPGSFDRGLDMAVVISAQPFAAPLQPVAVTTQNGLESHAKLVQAGFGFTDFNAEKTTYPDFGQLRTLSNAVPTAAGLGQDAPEHLFAVTNDEAGATLGGDSGGPLYVQKDASLLLRGVLSGSGPRLQRDPATKALKKDYVSIYLDISYFNQWLVCVTAAAEHPWVSEQDTTTARYIRCSADDTLKTTAQLAAHNAALCERWQGWALIAKPGETNKSQCWPSTPEACATYAERNTSPNKWDEREKACLPL